MPSPSAVHPIAALAACAALLGCGTRAPSAGATDAGRDAADAPVMTIVGNACRAAEDCPAMGCLTTFERACAGPVRPHTWRAEFPGGYCGPAPELATGTLASTCPAGSFMLSAFVGCDGVPFRWCSRRCATDADCRAAEGYSCHREFGGCAPPAFAAEPADAGT